MPNPLNPVLYQQLRSYFKSVKISDEGQEMVARYGTNFLTERTELQITNSGEYYAVSCNVCNDTRHRLWINHRWGFRDEKGHRNLWLAHCYNEGCYTKPGVSQDLLDRLESMGRSSLADVNLNKGKIVLESPNIDLPGAHFLLNHLPAEHPACKYLAGRFYNPERLGRFYNVGYCPDSYFYLAKNRIVAPVYFLGNLKGFQARHIGDMNWKAENAPPKWWTDPRMRKNMVLYNYDNARRYRTGVVVEGPGDVWGLGPMGVSTLGASMSAKQAGYLVDAFKEHSLVMLWDPDILKNPPILKHFNEKVLPLLGVNIDRNGEMVDTGLIRGGVAVVWLPEETDPGLLDREFMRDYIEYEAGKQNVKVDWRLR